MSDEQEQSEQRISFQFNDGEDEDMTDFSMSAGRRHTVGSKDKEAMTARKQSAEISRPKFSPPDVMTESLYTAVNKKNKRYPAPEVPAPPPPYEGKAVKDNIPKKMPSGAQGAGAQGEPTNNAAERSLSPPGYEPVAASIAPTSTGPVRPQGVPPRFPPSRPSRPPAGTKLHYLSCIMCAL